MFTQTAAPTSSAANGLCSSAGLFHGRSNEEYRRACIPGRASLRLPVSWTYALHGQGARLAAVTATQRYQLSVYHHSCLKQVPSTGSAASAVTAGWIWWHRRPLRACSSNQDSAASAAAVAVGYDPSQSRAIFAFCIAHPHPPVEDSEGEIETPMRPRAATIAGTLSFIARPHSCLRY